MNYLACKGLVLSNSGWETNPQQMKPAQKLQLLCIGELIKTIKETIYEYASGSIQGYSRS